MKLLTKIRAAFSGKRQCSGSVGLRKISERKLEYIAELKFQDDQNARNVIYAQIVEIELCLQDLGLKQNKVITTKRN